MANANTKYQPFAPEWKHVESTPAPKGEKVFISTDNPLDEDFPVTAYVGKNGFLRADGSSYSDPAIVYWMQIDCGLPMVPPRKGRYQLFNKDDSARFFDALYQVKELKKTWIKQSRTWALNHFDVQWSAPDNCKGATRCGLKAELPFIEVNYWVGDPPEMCGPISMDLMVRCRDSYGEVQCMSAFECNDTLKDPVPAPEEIKERAEIERDREGSQCPYARQARLIGKRVEVPFFVSDNGLSEDDLDD